MSLAGICGMPILHSSSAIWDILVMSSFTLPLIVLSVEMLWRLSCKRIIMEIPLPIMYVYISREDVYDWTDLCHSDHYTGFLQHGVAHSKGRAVGVAQVSPKERHHAPKRSYWRRGKEQRGCWFHHYHHHPVSYHRHDPWLPSTRSNP